MISSTVVLNNLKINKSIISAKRVAGYRKRWSNNIINRTVKMLWLICLHKINKKISQSKKTSSFKNPVIERSDVNDGGSTQVEPLNGIDNKLMDATEKLLPLDKF